MSTKGVEEVTVKLKRHRVEQVILPQLGRLPDNMPLLSAPQRGALRDLLDALRAALHVEAQPSFKHPRCKNCGKVGDRTFAKAHDGEWRDVLSAAQGITVDELQCSACDGRDFELVDPQPSEGEAANIDALALWLFRFQAEAQMADVAEAEARWALMSERDKGWYRTAASRLCAQADPQGLTRRERDRLDDAALRLERLAKEHPNLVSLDASDIRHEAEVIRQILAPATKGTN